MADYTLQDGKGTSVREDAGQQEGYVDLDINGLSALTPLQASDQVAIQRGSNNPQKSTLTTLKALLDSIAGYETLWIGAGAMTPSETNGATAETVEYGTNDITHDVMRFAGADNDTHAEFDVVMPEAWDRSTIKVKVYWTAGGDANPDEYVEFYLAAGARGDDDPLDAALGTAVDIADQVVADEDLHITAASGALTVGGSPALGDLVHFKLSRDYDHDGGGTAMDVDADVLGVLIQYKRDQAVNAW
jgi:hypothetical protein